MSNRILSHRLNRSGLPTVATFGLIPAVPPQLLPGSRLISPDELMDRSHGFLDPYAAGPGNLVAWTVLAGVVLAIVIGGRRGIVIGAATALTVVLASLATGHHDRLDVLIGASFVLLPFAAMGALRFRRRRNEGLPTGTAAGPVPDDLGRWYSIHAGTLFLGLLLGYLLIGQIVDPGFTDYWGYQVSQVAITMVVIWFGEGRRNRPPVFSWETRAIVVAATWADCLGTAGHLYDRFVVYDKITHFFGAASLALVCAEVLALLARRGRITWRPSVQIAVAVAFAMCAEFTWEVYEFMADEVFGTGRVQGAEDTRNDVFSDSAGAIVAALVVARRRAVADEEGAPTPAREPAEAE
jgi:hypothetical protein